MGVVWSPPGAAMELIAALRVEHELIEAVAGSLRTYVTRRVTGGGGPGDLARFLAFFERFIGGFHHAREEEVLMPALVREAGVPGDRGPLAVMLADHHEMASMRRRLAALAAGADWSQSELAEVEALAVAFSRHLWAHIDAENTVLFPEAERVLRRSGVAELAGRATTADEAAAEADGRALVALYPPLEDREAIRGEGCVVCPAYLERCAGIEREWWAEQQWEEFHSHLE